MAEESIEEQEMGDVPENTHPHEIHGSEHDSKKMAEESIEEQKMGDVPENTHPHEIHGSEHDSKKMAEESIEEQEMGDVPENTHPHEIHGSEHDSKKMAEESIEEQEMGDMPENLHIPEIQGSEHDSKVDKCVISEEKKWPGWPGENVFRMLVPVQKVGSIIGRKGEYIKKTCEETKARIKILDGPPGTTERTVMVSAKEEPDVPVPPAMDGLLKVHKRIVDFDTDPAHTVPGAGLTVCTRMLVAGTQGGSLIGKQGATIKSIQDASNCTIRVLGGENLPFFALPDDSVVEVQGEATGVHKAVELIATHLRKFLVDRSVIGIFEMQMQMQNARGNQDMPPPQSWGPPPQVFPLNAGGGPGFAPTTQYLPPQRQFDNYYPQADMPPMDKQPRQGPPAYGRDGSIGTHTTSMQPHQSMVTKVSQNMQIPLTYADTVIGTSGTNISYIRRASGATIAIQESRGIPGEMTVEINGSASQVQTAQQLIQNFIAEAASAAQKPPGAAPPGQGYNPYPSHGTMYPSQPPDATGHAPAGDYASVYGNNYGY